jgi:hypothetical protein
MILAALDGNNADLDRQESELRHENTDVTDVMNWIAGIRRHARLAAQNVETLELKTGL